MPNATINKVAKETDLTKQELEDKWEMAENIASEKFKKDDDGYYPYVMGIFKNSLPASAKGVLDKAKTESIWGLIDTLASGYNVMFEAMVNITNISCPHCGKSVKLADLQYETDEEEWYHPECKDKGPLTL